MEFIIISDDNSVLRNGKYFLKQKREKIAGSLKKINGKEFYLFSVSDKDKKKKIKSGKITLFNKKGKKEGKGRIIFLFSGESEYLKEKVLKNLDKLSGFSTKERISFLIEISDKRGISGQFILSNFNRKKIDIVIPEFELTTEILILSLYDYTFIKREYLPMIYNRVLQVISRREVKNGIRFGVKKSELRKRAQVKDLRLFNFILKKLEADGKIEFYSDRYFTRRGDILTEEEEEIIKKLEEIYSKEKFNPMDEDNLARELGIDKILLKKYLDILIEKKKILPVKGGFFLNEEYLQYLIRELRKMKVHKPKFKIKDFREITGLSRKYSVPILELLDYLEITKRVGDQREILV